MINKDNLAQYKKSLTSYYTVNEWFDKMKANDAIDSFFPGMVPKVLMRELGMEEEKACYWTYDLFKANLITPKEKPNPTP